MFNLQNHAINLILEPCNNLKINNQKVTGKYSCKLGNILLYFSITIYPPYTFFHTPHTVTTLLSMAIGPFVLFS